MSKKPPVAFPPDKPRLMAVEGKPEPKPTPAQVVKFWGVARLDTGGYHVVEVDLPLDDPRVRVTTRSRLPKHHAYEQLILASRRGVFMPPPRPHGQGGGGAA